MNGRKGYRKERDRLQRQDYMNGKPRSRYIASGPCPSSPALVRAGRDKYVSFHDRRQRSDLAAGGQGGELRPVSQRFPLSGAPRRSLSPTQPRGQPSGSAEQSSVSQ
jgi:hypothetical protein